MISRWAASAASRSRMLRNTLPGTAMGHGWWINRPTLCKPTSGRFLVMRQSEQAISPWREAPSDFSCWHPHPSLRGMTLHPSLALVPLMLKSEARGKRVPRTPSNVGRFCRRPSPAFVADSGAPPACPVVATCVIRSKIASLVTFSFPFYCHPHTKQVMRKVPG